MSAFRDLRRSATDRKVSGLCGGAARQWGIDPLLVRVLAVLLAVSGGIGVVLYLAGWLLIPEDGHDESLANRWVPQSKAWPREVWIVAVVVACVACAGALGSIAPVGLAPALIIVAVWYFGFRHRGPSGPNGPEQQRAAVPPARVHDPLAGPPTPFTHAARQWQARVAEHQTQAQGRTESGLSGAAAPRPPAPAVAATAPDPAGNTRPAAAGLTPTDDGVRGSVSGERSDPFFQVADPVGLYTAPTSQAATQAATSQAAMSQSLRRRAAGATPAARRLRFGILLTAALGIAGLAAAQALGASVPWVLYPSIALLIFGIGLVIATWAGRARGLLALGIVLLIATPLTQLGAEAADRIPTQWGSDTVSYSRQQELPAAGDSFPGGDYTVDLSALTVTKPQTYTVHVQMGQLRIVLPQDARVDVRGSAGTGSVNLPGKQAGGKVDRLEGVYGPGGPNDPTLIINASVDVGSVEVVR